MKVQLGKNGDEEVVLREWHEGPYERQCFN